MRYGMRPHRSGSRQRWRRSSCPVTHPQPALLVRTVSLLPSFVLLRPTLWLIRCYAFLHARPVPDRPISGIRAKKKHQTIENNIYFLIIFFASGPGRNRVFLPRRQVIHFVTLRVTAPLTLRYILNESFPASTIRQLCGRVAHAPCILPARAIRSVGAEGLSRAAAVVPRPKNQVPDDIGRSRGATRPAPRPSADPTIAGRITACRGFRSQWPCAGRT